MPHNTATATAAMVRSGSGSGSGSGRRCQQVARLKPLQQPQQQHPRGRGGSLRGRQVVRRGKAAKQNPKHNPNNKLFLIFTHPKRQKSQQTSAPLAEQTNNPKQTNKQTGTIQSSP
jgi:hypothetical protein